MQVITVTKYKPENLHECVYDIGIMDGSCINCTYRRSFTGNPESPCKQRTKFEQMERIERMKDESARIMDEFLGESHEENERSRIRNFDY
jgi:hypothetical protein